MNKLLAGLALAFAASAPAQALDFVSVSATGGSIGTDYSGDGLLSFDIDFTSLAPVTFTYAVTQADLAGPIDFNAVIRNYTGRGFDGLAFTLGGASFEAVGSVTRGFGGNTAVTTSATGARLAFTPVEFLDVLVGNPLGNATAVDWRIASSGLRVGDTLSFSVVSSVPEPQSYALMLAGMLLLGFEARRRSKR